MRDPRARKLLRRHLALQARQLELHAALAKLLSSIGCPTAALELRAKGRPGRPRVGLGGTA